MTFGEKLKKLRLEKKMSQEALAKEIGLSRSAIAKYENNEREPNFEAIKKIENYFNISANEIINDLNSTDYIIEGKKMFKSVLNFTNPTVLSKIIENKDKGLQNSIYVILSNFMKLLGNLDNCDIDRLFLIIKLGDMLESITSEKSRLYYRLTSDLNQLIENDKIELSKLENYINSLNRKKTELYEYIDNYIESYNPINHDNLIFKNQINEMSKEYKIDEEMYELLKIAHELENNN